ncbi:hypothetical protein LC608_08605 [Nostoc sp. XA010]|uniref:hypothetical protein n=1 Tax=Nostoc sp. XA010 TaxID=2780407 RepID=UPI001E2B8C75|nr:hypothetical protein [Nostoc sp. XA010]MCC5657047.1 hypothetical protein [Nostoc sp. XA010]
MNRIKEIEENKIALIGWELFREVEIMQLQINRLFDQMLSPQESDRLRGDVVHHGIWHLHPLPKSTRLPMPLSYV